MGQSVKDETKEYCQKLSEECTKQVKVVIKQINLHNLQEAENSLQ
jgi:predicted translin family RNA/ssDNA-binding protein